MFPYKLGNASPILAHLSHRWFGIGKQIRNMTFDPSIPTRWAPKPILIKLWQLWDPYKWPNKNGFHQGYITPKSVEGHGFPSYKCFFGPTWLKAAHVFFFCGFFVLKKNSHQGLYLHLPLAVGRWKKVDSQPSKQIGPHLHRFLYTYNLCIYY